MLSDEEKQSIESLKNIAIYIGDNYTFSQQGIRNLRENLRIVLPVIEKQSKEIEHQKEKRANQKKELAILNAKQIEFNKLVNTVNSYKGQFKRQEKEIEELKDKNKKLQDKAKELIFEKQELTSALLDSTPNDKIKVTIEELEKQDREDRMSHNYLVIPVLQSLLEKE